MLDRADHKLFFTQKKYFTKGGSAGHLLASIIQAQRGSPHISRLVRVDSSEATVDVLAMLKDFYAHLYTSKSEGCAEDLLHYLTDIPTPALFSDTREALDQPLTLEELERALQLAPNEKAPGSDRLTH